MGIDNVNDLTGDEPTKSYGDKQFVDENGRELDRAGRVPEDPNDEEQQRRAAARGETDDAKARHELEREAADEAKSAGTDVHHDPDWKYEV